MENVETFVDNSFHFICYSVVSALVWWLSFLDEYLISPIIEQG
jgi:hypothetical protein